MSHKTLERLEYLRKSNSNKRWVNNQLYRLMYKEDLYIVAYERMKSKPGNMTAGTDKETLDGFSLGTIREIIHEMRTEQFQFKPVRTTFIPKANGKMRKLGIPCVRDKVVRSASCICSSKPSTIVPTAHTSVMPATAFDQIAVVTRPCEKFAENGQGSTGSWRETFVPASTKLTTQPW